MKDVLSFIKDFGFVNFFFVIMTLMDPLGLGYLFGYIAVALFFLNRNELKNGLDSFFLTLLAFSLIYSSFYFLNPWKGLQYFIIYLISPPIFYLWGKKVSKTFKNLSQGFLVLMILGVLYSLPALISVVLNILEGGFAQPERNISMFWGGGLVNATGMAAFLMFNMCIPGLLIAGFKVLPRSFVVFFIIVLVLSVASVLRLGSRTQLVIMFVSLILALLYVTPKLTLKQNIVIYFTLIGTIALIFQNISFNLDSDLFTSFAGRMKDGGAEDLAGGGGRVELWEKSIDFMFEYPLGWDLEAFGYSHNLWLDTLRVGGVIPAIILVIYFIKVYGLLLKALLDKTLAVSMRLILFLFNLAFLAVFMVEPGIDGTFSMFLFFCFFSGIMFNTYWINRTRFSKIDLNDQK